MRMATSLSIQTAAAGERQKAGTSRKTTWQSIIIAHLGIYPREVKTRTEAVGVYGPLFTIAGRWGPPRVLQPHPAPLTPRHVTGTSQEHKGQTRVCTAASVNPNHLGLKPVRKAADPDPLF